MEEVVRKLKNNKSPGENGILAKMLLSYALTIKKAIKPYVRTIEKSSLKYYV